MLGDISEAMFLKWFVDNHDKLWPLYSEYVSEMQDSMSHKQYLINSDECYRQWAEEYYETNRTFTKPALTIAEWKGQDNE